MDPLTIGLLTGGASLLGSIFSSNTAKENTEANNAAQLQNSLMSMQFNRQEAATNREFQSGQADINRQFVEGMSSSAYQRARKDMVSAGLNPALAAMQGGASTPGGTQPSSTSASVGIPQAIPSQARSAFADLGENAGKAVNAAVSMKTYEKMVDEMANLKAMEAQRKAETSLVGQRTKTEEQETLKRSTEASLRQFELPAARVAAKQSEAVEKLPSWVIDSLSQIDWGAKKSGSTADIISSLVGSSRGVQRLLQYPNNPGKKYNSFEDRWPD